MHMVLLLVLDYVLPRHGLSSPDSATPRQEMEPMTRQNISSTLNNAICIYSNFLACIGKKIKQFQFKTW